MNITIVIYTSGNLKICITLVPHMTARYPWLLQGRKTTGVNA